MNVFSHLDKRDNVTVFIFAVRSLSFFLSQSMIIILINLKLSRALLPLKLSNILIVLYLSHIKYIITWLV